MGWGRAHVCTRARARALCDFSWCHRSSDLVSRLDHFHLEESNSRGRQRGRDAGSREAEAEAHLGTRYVVCCCCLQAAAMPHRRRPLMCRRRTPPPRRLSHRPSPWPNAVMRCYRCDRCRAGGEKWKRRDGEREEEERGERASEGAPCP